MLRSAPLSRSRPRSRASMHRGGRLVHRRPPDRVRGRRLFVVRHRGRLPPRQPRRPPPGSDRSARRARCDRDDHLQRPQTHAGRASCSRPSASPPAGLAGFALRAREVQAEAAEQRAILAEREREAAARIAVAEERARIARELHDIVAHAVSVMLLQVGAVRHKLPEALAEDKNALQGSRAGRPLGARRDETPPRRDAPERRGHRTDAPARPRQRRRSARRGRTSRPSRTASARRRPLPAPARGRSLRLPDHPGGPHQRPQARACKPRRRDRPLRLRAICRSRSATTAAVPDPPTASATGSWACASA